MAKKVKDKKKKQAKPEIFVKLNKDLTFEQALDEVLKVKPPKDKDFS